MGERTKLKPKQILSSHTVLGKGREIAEVSEVRWNEVIHICNRVIDIMPTVAAMHFSQAFDAIDI